MCCRPLSVIHSMSQYCDFTPSQVASANPVCPQVAFDGLTRFEDRSRLPLGISVNMTAYSARLLTQVRSPAAPVRDVKAANASASMPGRCHSCLPSHRGVGSQPASTPLCQLHQKWALWQPAGPQHQGSCKIRQHTRMLQAPSESQGGVTLRLCGVQGAGLRSQRDSGAGCSRTASTTLYQIAMLLQVGSSAAGTSKNPSLVQRPTIARVAHPCCRPLHLQQLAREACGRDIGSVTQATSCCRWRARQQSVECFAPFQSHAGAGGIQPRRDAALLQAG